MLALLLLAPLLSSCSVVYHTGRQAELDYFGTGYRLYIYQRPTVELAVSLKNLCVYQNGSGREAWGRCSLTALRGYEVQAVARVDWNSFTAGGKWDDYTDAIGQVSAGGVLTDSRGNQYARKCLVADHSAFNDHNWTSRVASDGHCHIGDYAIATAK